MKSWLVRRDPCSGLWKFLGIIALLLLLLFLFLFLLLLLLLFLFKRLSCYSLFVSHDLQSSYELLAIGAFNTLLGCSNNQWYTLLHGWCRVKRLKVVYKHKFPEGTIGLYESLKYALNKCSFSSYFNRMQFEELNFKTNLRNESNLTCLHQYFGFFLDPFQTFAPTCIIPVSTKSQVTTLLKYLYSTQLSSASAQFWDFFPDPLVLGGSNVSKKETIIHLGNLPF